MDKYEIRRLNLIALMNARCKGKGKQGKGKAAVLADKLERSASYVSRMLAPEGTRNKKNIGEDMVELIEDAFKLRSGALDEVENLQAGDGSNAFQVAPTDKGDSGFVEIEQYNDVGGGMGGGVTLHDQPGEIQGWRVTPEWISKNIKSHTGAGNLCIVTGFGNSMQPLYNPGDPLIIDTGIKSVDADATYFFRVGDEGFIKILQRIPGEGIRVISKNKDYETWTIKPDMDFEVFGQVLKAWCGTDV